MGAASEKKVDRGSEMRRLAIGAGHLKGGRLARMRALLGLFEIGEEAEEGAPVVEAVAAGDVVALAEEGVVVFVDVAVGGPLLHK